MVWRSSPSVVACWFVLLLAAFLSFFFMLGVLFGFVVVVIVVVFWYLFCSAIQKTLLQADSFMNIKICILEVKVIFQWK